MDEVWRLHADVNAWTSWQTDITAASIEGAFEVGNSFSWSSYGLAVTSTIYAITDHSRVLWGGTGAGITGIHEWLFAETPDGVHVTTNESFAGQPVEADATNMQSLLDASLVSWLDQMKKAAESRASASIASLLTAGSRCGMLGSKRAALAGAREAAITIESRSMRPRAHDLLD